MTDSLEPTNPEPSAGGQLLIYQDGALNLQVRLDGQTVWLSQRLLAELYQVSVKTVNEHLINIFDEGELDPEATIRKFRIVQTEGNREVTRLIDHYNLDAILAVGYRVRSHQGTRFRQWATTQLRELLLKGFVLDDERLKSGRTIGQDYFDELLARIRDIRASERLFYQKITDIYATSIDYDPRADISNQFFAAVQNKLHWAIHGCTAAEIIRARADAAKPNMGLTTWKNAPRGPIRKTDVGIAKNYLSEPEITELNRIVSMYLDYAEDQARKKKPMYMRNWVQKLDAFLQFNERNLLTHKGTISHELALDHAHAEFAKYDAQRLALEARQPTTDFDQLVEESRQVMEEVKEPEQKKQIEGKTKGKRKRGKKEGG